MTRDRVIVGTALGVLILVTWLYIIRASTDMRYMGGGIRIFWMWAVMMVARMTPSAAPMVFAFSRVSGSRAGWVRG